MYINHKKTVLYFVPHQDDELLTMGIDICKDDDISVFLSDPEIYDYDAYKKRQNRKRFLAKLISHLRNIL